jgi:hypothetical protein
MRKIVFILVLIFLMWVSVTNGQWFENGKPAADTSWRKGWGKFGAMLHLTDRPDELFQAWEKPGAGVPVSNTEIAKRGKPVVGVVFFTGCATDENGHCNAEAIFQVFKPDGSPYGKKEHGELWIGKPPPPYGKLQLSMGAIGVVIKPNDPNGIYTVHGYLRDKISHAEVELNRTFRVLPGEGENQSQE